MSYNGSGTFVINTAGQPVVSGTVISSTAFNALTADLATGLSTAITKDGQTTPTANIPMGNNKITNLAVGTAATDAANLSQVQSTTAKLVNSISGADTITGTMSPNLAAYATGQMFYFIAAGDNTGAVTLNIDSLGAKAVTRDGTTALAAGDIQSGEVCVVVYDGTRFQLVNGASQSASIVTENLTVNKATVLNESGGDNDTRIEGDTDANLVFVDASTDRVGVGTSSPGRKLEVASSTAALIRITSSAASGTGYAATEFYNGAGFGYCGTESSAAGTLFVGSTAYATILGNTAAYPIQFATNNNVRATIDSSGNLGLGTTSPSDRLHVKGVLRIEDSTDTTTRDYQLKVDTTGGLAFIDTVGPTTKMFLDFAGNLGVGTTSPGARLHVEQNTGSAIFRVKRTANDIFDIYQGSSVTYLDSTPAGGVLAFATAGTERARITSGGDLIVGATASTDPGVTIYGSTKGIIWQNNNAQGNGFVFTSYRRSNTEIGSVSQNGTTAVLYNINSDRRLKDNIAPAPNAGEKIDAIEIVSYDWKSAPDEHVEFGVVAQDLYAIVPQAVNVGNDGEEIEKTWGVDYSKLVPMLVKEIQSLRARVAALEAK